MNVGMRKKESKRGKLGFPIVPIHMTSSEVGLTESDIKQIRESDRIKESWSKKNNKKVINYLLSHPEVVSRTNQGHIQSRQIIELLRQY